MWSCPGNMPKYYPGLRDILPDRKISLQKPTRSIMISHIMAISFIGRENRNA